MSKKVKSEQAPKEPTVDEVAIMLSNALAKMSLPYANHMNLQNGLTWLVNKAKLSEAKGKPLSKKEKKKEAKDGSK